MAASSAFASAGIDVSLTQQPDRAYEVRGSFLVEASTAVVWDVLSDYEGIPAFVSSMRKSRVKERRPDGTVVLEQEAVGGMFFVSKKVRVVLEVRRSTDRMDFLDVDRRDFWIYSGDWATAPAPEGTRVSYDLTAQPDFPAPSFVMRGVMRRGARDLLAQVRDEIQRRSQGKVAVMVNGLALPADRP